MKKLIIVLFVSLFFTVGCGSKFKNPIIGLKFNSDMKEIAILLAAEELGERFAKEFPDKVQYAKERVEFLSEDQADNAFQLLFQKSITELSAEVSNNPSTQKKLELLISRMEINSDIGLNKEVVDAFKIGLGD